MPQATPEELKQRLKDEVDKQHNKEYEVDTELQEIKELGGATSDELSKDSIDKMASQADVMIDKLDDILEHAKETAGDLPLDTEDDPAEKVNLGQYMKEIRHALTFGEMGPTLSAIKDFKRGDLSNGVPLPDHLKGIFDYPRRKTTGFLEEGQGSMGGFTVPEQFIANVLAPELLPPIMRPRAFTIEATTNVVKIPVINETTRSGSVFGGVVGYWTAESGTITKSNPAFGQRALTAKKLALLTYVTNELLDDNAVGLTAILERIFGEALGWYEDMAFINGSGVNEPLGLRNSGAKLASAATTTSTAFLIADACKLFAKMMPGTERRGIWLMNPGVRDALPQMVSASGGDNVWYPRNILTVKDSPEPWELLGMPIFWTEHTPAFGTDEDIMLIDPLNYLVMSRQDVRVAVSTDSRFETDETGYKLTQRSDGQNWMTSSLTLADGSTTVSPVVYNNHT